MEAAMHEFSLAKNIVGTALAETKKHNGKRIATLSVKLSNLSHITPDNLEFCLTAAATGTAAEKAKIEIETFDPAVLCQECGHTFSFKKSEPFCPQCRSKKLKMVDVSEAFLESLEVD
jgi:hydrogenase nickel incorporation protein HypA/HybF